MHDYCYDEKSRKGEELNASVELSNFIRSYFN